MKFRDKLYSGDFMVTVELFPPKGVELDSLFEKAYLLADHVDAFNITDNQRATMRLGPVAISHLLIEKGFECICQFSCRDRNCLALQSDFLSAAALGIENILVVTGDPPASGDHPQACGVFEVDSIALLRGISELMKGKDMAGKKLNGSPDFLVGAVVNPGSEEPDKEFDRMREKADSGAEFFQTQVFFDKSVFTAFREKTSDVNRKVLAGILPLRSARMARMLDEKVPGISVPKEHIARMEKSPDPVATGLEIASELIESIKDVADGIHIMTIGHEKSVLELLRRAGLA